MNMMMILCVLVPAHDYVKPVCLIAAKKLSGRCVVRNAPIYRGVGIAPV